MKFLIVFLASFVGSLLLTGIIRSASLTAKMETVDSEAMQGDGEHANHQRQSEGDGHSEHQGGEGDEHAGRTEMGEQGLSDKEDADAVDLRNDIDPVDGTDISKGRDLVLSHKGFLVHFSSEKTRSKFIKWPVRYYATLSLEPSESDELKLVDSSTYRDPVIPEECPFMGGEIDPEGEVYVLHRGFKIYFCCWGGCDKDFLEEPSKYYQDYGLEDRDGTLALKE